MGVWLCVLEATTPLWRGIGTELGLGREWSMNGEEGRRKADLEAARSKEESADTAEASN